ncbi:MAG: tRNA pseudouridine(55) synthase TruB [Burkholderiales bacterium]|jgi:tRNA pseudouridine55 synthase|nr:tRNA pseudouridine(55) synthase TruB [Burkholderiales bacterium]
MNWRRVDGVLLFDKPVGMSSNAALQKVRRLFQAEKGGHMGTLDPFASGLLPLCFGEATKFSRFVLDADKTYRATLRLGVTTTTSDPEGDVVETCEFAHVDLSAVENALAHFHGDQQQIPPRHAALKYQGRAYYEYARAGIEIPREARTIKIHSLRLLDFVPPILVIDAHVSKGTYIRTLAEDLGATLGCGAHLTALRRLHSGPFSITSAYTLESLEAMSGTERMTCLLPTETLVHSLPRADLTPTAANRFSQGQRLALRDVEALSIPDQVVYAVYTAPFPKGASAKPAETCSPQGEKGAVFLGVAEVREGALRPLRLLT